MQQEIYRIGMLVVLPLLLATLALYFIGVADAYESEENISHTSSSPIELVSEEDEQIFTQILYSIKVGTEEYFLHFNVCAGEKSIVSPSIILESEQDTVQINSTKIIYENSCQSFESIIDTKSPQLVKITVVEKEPIKEHYRTEP